MENEFYQQINEAKLQKRSEALLQKQKNSINRDGLDIRDDLEEDDEDLDL